MRRFGLFDNLLLFVLLFDSFYENLITLMHEMIHSIHP